MLTRRSLLTGGILAGTAAGTGGAATLTPGDGAAANAQSSSRRGDTDEQLVKAVEEIRDLLKGASGGNAPELVTIRNLQREFLKGRGKFPDFIEVGIDVWESLVNWHVRTRQPQQIGRMADGRYTMAVFQTNLILRHDVSNSYIGQPFDAK